METQTDNLGKVSVTVEKDFWSPNKSYDKLTIVLVEDKFATYISRKPVPTGMSLGNREFWIPFSSLKELIILDYSRISTKVDGLANVAYTGEYSDLKHTPDISNKTITLKRSDGSIIGEFTLNQASDKEIEINLPAALVLADWRLDDVTAADYIKNKPELHKVATSGKYEDLENKPEIGKGKLVITDGVHRNDTFNANSEEDLTVILSKVAFTNDFKDLDNRHKLTINNGDGTSTVYDGTEDKTINVSNPTNVHDGVLTIEDYYGNHKKTFSANQEEDEKVVLSELAFSGHYNDIIDAPDSKITIKCNNIELGNFHLNDTTDTEINIVVPNALGDPVVQVQSDWNESNPNNPAYINNKPTIGNATITVKQGNIEQRFKVNDTNDLELIIASANDGKLTIKDNAGHLAEFTADLRGDTIVNLEKVAFTGDYDDLTNKPDGMLVFLRNGQTVTSFSAGSRTLTPVDLGNPGDTNKIETISVNGNRQTIDNNKNVDLAIGNAVVNVSLNGSLVKTFSLNQSGDPIDINLADSGEINKLETVSVNGTLLPINNKNVDITIPPAGQDNVIEAITVNGLPTLIINKTVDITVPQASGEVNKIESISINGVTLQIDLTKNVDIPLKTLTIVDPNGQRYTYNATSDVTIQLPAGQSTAGFSYEVYSNRNLITNPQTNVLYLIGPESNDYSTHDRFEEWVYTTNLGWAKIGTTEIDLSQYYTRTLVDNLIGNGTLTINVGNNAPVTFSANEPTNSNKLVTIGDGVYEIYQNNLLKGTIQANAANLTPVQINLDGGGDANIIEQVQVNGQALTPDNNKAVNVLVPIIDKHSKDIFYSYRQSTLGIWTSDIFNQPDVSTLFFAKFTGQDQNLTNYNNVNVLFGTWSTPRWTLPVYYRGSVLSGRTFNTLIEYPDSSESKSLVFYYDINNPTYVSLVGVYDSEGSYSRTQIDNMLSNINSFGFEFYRNTQAISNPNSQTLYIIGPSGAGDDYYEEYVFSNGNLVKIGDVTKDLSIYAQIANLARVAFTGDFDDLINIPYDSLELTYGNNQVSLGIFDTNRHNTPQSINIPEPGNGSLIILDELLNIREQFYANQPGDHYLPLANVAFTGNVTDLHGYVAPGQVNNAPLTINHDGISDIFTANASQPVVVNITPPENGILTINEGGTQRIFTANDSNNVNVTIGDGILNIQAPSNVSWRTPTIEEFDYLINTRNTQARFAKCQIDRLYNCLIIFPDNYTTTLSNVNLNSSLYTDNLLSLQDAIRLTSDGCVILSSLGGLNGCYLTASVTSNNRFVCSFAFDNTYVYSRRGNSSASFSLRRPVRLITNSSSGIGTFTINANGDTCSFAPGDLRYDVQTQDWYFAPNQWDPLNNGINYIDLFGYGTSGYSNGLIAYEPTTNNNQDSAYYNQNLYDSPNNSADWGYAYSLQHLNISYLFRANQTNNTNINLAAVAFTGDYNSLSNLPSNTNAENGLLEINEINNNNQLLNQYNFTANQPTGTNTQVNLREVAFTADYNHLINRPNAVGVSPGNGLFVVTRTDNGGNTTNAANFTADEPTGNVVTLPLHEVAFTGNYNDLQGIPPAVNAGNGLIDIISPQSNNTQSFTVNLPGPTQIYLPRETYTPTKTINGVLHAHTINLPLGSTIPDLTTIILSNVNPHDVETIWGEPIFIGPQGNTLITSANSVFYNGLVAEFRLTVSKIYSTSGVAQNGYNLVHWSYTQNAGSGGGNIETISIDGENIAADANNNVNITRQLLLGCDIVEATYDPIPANYTNLVTLAPVLRPTILVKHDAKPHDYLTINGLPMYIDDNTPLTHQNTLFIDNGFDEFRITVYPDDPVTPHYYRIIHFSYYLDVYRLLSPSNTPSNGGGSSGGGTTGSGANNTSEEINRRLRAAANSTLQTSNGTATSVLRLLDSSNSGTRFGRNVANSRTTSNNNILSGIYSVSATNTIRFTKGNLIYNYTQDTWSLHTNLWDAFEDRNLTTSNYDLFNYGCNSIGIGSNAATKANVLNWSTNYNEHILNSIRGNNGDWGRIYDDAYYRGHNSFRYYTLSSAEWLYLTSGRPYSRKFALGTYNNRNLLVLIPDGVMSDPVTLNNVNGDLFTDNTFTLSDLQALTNAGYAILPQTGFRYGLYGSARYQLDAVSIGSCVGGFNYLLSDNYTGNAPHPSALLYTPSTGLFVVSNYLVPTYGFAVRLVYGTPA